jgi:hypothetical protein
MPVTLSHYRKLMRQKDKTMMKPIIKPPHIVLIEGPEAHLHAQIQQVFITRRFSKSCVPTIGPSAYCGEFGHPHIIKGSEVRTIDRVATLQRNTWQNLPEYSPADFLLRKLTR